jgi:hypothetical protein
VYGARVSGTDLLVRDTIRPNAVTKPLVAALSRHAPARR